MKLQIKKQDSKSTLKKQKSFKKTRNIYVMFNGCIERPY